MSIVKLFVYIKLLNVKLLMSNSQQRSSSEHSEIMVKWKCLKLLYSSKGMHRINSELKKLIRLKYLIVETPYTFFSIFSWYFIVFTHLTSYRLCFQVLTITTFPFMAFLTFPFCVCFYNFIYFIFKYF